MSDYESSERESSERESSERESSERGSGSADEYEDDVRSWLAPLGGAEALPDEEFLRGLRERSGAEFLRAGEAAGAVTRTGEDASSDYSLSRPPRRIFDKRLGDRTMTRLMTAAVACAAALVIWLTGGLFAPRKAA